ncbi:hypothetical protein GTR00_22450, partial [Kineococcus sp. T90]
MPAASTGYRALPAAGTALQLPPSDRPWVLDVQWGRAAHLLDVAVQRFDAAGRPLGRALRGTRASADGTVVLDVDTTGQAEVWLHLDATPREVERVVVSARLPRAVTFADVGPVVLAVRVPRGSVLAVATLDAAAGAQALVLAEAARGGGA